MKMLKMFANADAYELFMGRWSRVLAPAFVAFARIDDGWHILDVGSGTGSLALEIAKRKPRCQITGIDLSPEYVAYMNSRHSNAAVRFEIASAQSLPYPAGQFDASLSLLAFNFVPDPYGALTELKRVTRRRGPICAAVWDYGGRMDMLRVFWDAAVALDPSADEADEKHMPLCTAGELYQLWKHAGLAEVEDQALEITMIFKSFDDYWEPFMAGQGPAGAYVARLSLDRRMELRDKIKRLLPDYSIPGTFELSARAWAIRGTVPS
jgi:SAM-dependent methyltransferase